MLQILREIVRPLLRGERAGFRVRIKPSWSGRVYGTYSLVGRHFFLAAVFVVTSTALFGRLLALTVATPPVAAEIATLRRCAAHEFANRAIAFPARTTGHQLVAERLFTQSTLIERILGVRQASDSMTGIGQMDLGDASVSGPSQQAIARLVADTSFLAKRFVVLDSALDERAGELRYTPSVVPISEAEFTPTSPFGSRLSPFTRRLERHRGVDLAADMYSKIVATADGIVSHVERNPRRSGMGMYVTVDHDGRYVSYYGHCARIFVEVGQVVQRHQLLAEVGSTGRSTGPHVHYELRRDGKAINPRDFMLLDPRFQPDKFGEFH